jgi:CMP-N,N'-diacetyllegionaminic acid synthase
MSVRSNIVATVCMRGGSKGVPRKNLKPLAGRPLLVHTVEQALACKCFDRVIANSDDLEMAEVARAAGAEVPFMRPPQLATDTASKWHVFRHLVQALEAREGYRVDAIADLDTGAILRTVSDIEATVRLLDDPRIQVGVTAYEAAHNPYYNLVEVNAAGDAEVSKPVQPPIVNRQAAPPAYCLSPATFAIRTRALFEREHWSACVMRLHIIPRERALDIDTQLDFALVETLFKAQAIGEPRR